MHYCFESMPICLPKCWLENETSRIFLHCSFLRKKLFFKKGFYVSLGYISDFFDDQAYSEAIFQELKIHRDAEDLKDHFRST